MFLLSVFLNLNRLHMYPIYITYNFLIFRFKLHLLIKDDTGETRVLLLDSIVEPILGVSAEVLLDGSLEEVCKSFHFIVIYFIYAVVFNVLFVHL